MEQMKKSGIIAAVIAGILVCGSVAYSYNKNKQVETVAAVDDQKLERIENLLTRAETVTSLLPEAEQVFNRFYRNMNRVRDAQHEWERLLKHTDKLKDQTKALEAFRTAVLKTTNLTFRKKNMIELDKIYEDENIQWSVGEGVAHLHSDTKTTIYRTLLAEAPERQWASVSTKNKSVHFTPDVRGLDIFIDIRLRSGASEMHFVESSIGVLYPIEYKQGTYQGRVIEDVTAIVIFFGRLKSPEAGNELSSMKVEFIGQQIIHKAEFIIKRP